MHVRQRKSAAIIVCSASLLLIGGQLLVQKVSGQDQPITATSKIGEGLNTTVFHTPAGNINLNLPEDMSSGDTLTGSVIVEPNPGKTPEETAENQDKLNGYVVEIKQAEEAPPAPPPVTTAQAPPPPESPKKQPKQQNRSPRGDAKDRWVTCHLPRDVPKIIVNLIPKPPSWTVAQNPSYPTPPHYPPYPPSSPPSHTSSGVIQDSPQPTPSAPPGNTGSISYVPGNKPRTPIKPSHSDGGVIQDSPQSSADQGQPVTPLSSPNTGSIKYVNGSTAQKPQGINSSSPLVEMPPVCSLPVPVPPEPKEKLPPGSCVLPDIGQCGHPIPVKCSDCSGYPNDNSVKVGGKPCDGLAYGPRGSVFKSPGRVVGPTDITFTKGGKVAKAPFHNIAVKLSCSNPVVKKGETTTMIVKVFGLKGLTHPVTLTLDNFTPNVVSLEGGNHQVITINPTGSDTQTFPLQQ